jgi:hypothetical protein
MNRNTLHLNLHQRFFWDIAAGAKRMECRGRTQYWKNRLENQQYDVINLRNGYVPKAPELLVEFRGLRKRRRTYEILLGRILEIKRWKPPKPSKSQIARAQKYINSMEWTFARSMPQWPHWWVLRENGSGREFDFVDQLIKKFGYPDPWRTRIKYSFVLGKFKYWVDEDCLNRGAAISNAEVIKRGARYAARHGKRIGPWGRLISVKKRCSNRRSSRRSNRRS